LARVVLGVSGGIGAYRAAEVLRELQRRGHDVRVVMTQNATRFVSPMTFEALSRQPVFVDAFALGADASMRHISFADEAELLLVAPATANVLGKFARGIADDALSTLYLATKAAVVVAPAMNVNMFEHPAVIENLATLRGRGVRVVEPGEGYLACGWLGKGRLADVKQIADAAQAALGAEAAPANADLAGVAVLVTAGPTVEDLDPVRFLSNRSSGRMGYAVAEAARDRGARVVLVSGPTSLEVPRGVDFVAVRSARDMEAAVDAASAWADVIVMAAAVSDFRPQETAPRKIKKTDADGELRLVRNPDILAGLGARKGSRFLVGFAAETDAMVDNAEGKLRRKGLDLIVANDVSRADRGFVAETNAAVLLDAAGGREELPLMGKRELADRLWDRIVALRGAPAAARGAS
jgi:phosphopantothenoylcysteine decarboxylase/phosphopantothenate--cysteine ligase